MTDLETKLRELRDSTWHDSIEGDMSKLRAAAAIGAAQRQAEVERLGAALAYYGTHSARCIGLASVLQGWTTADGAQCTCGFLDALGEAKGRP